jgi:hypothetical protein
LLAFGCETICATVSVTFSFFFVLSLSCFYLWPCPSSWRDKWLCPDLSWSSAIVWPSDFTTVSRASVECL